MGEERQQRLGAKGRSKLAAEESIIKPLSPNIHPNSSMDKHLNTASKPGKTPLQAKTAFEQRKP